MNTWSHPRDRYMSNHRPIVVPKPEKTKMAIAKDVGCVIGMAAFVGLAILASALEEK